MFAFRLRFGFDVVVEVRSRSDLHCVEGTCLGQFGIDCLHNYSKEDPF